jgi:hypothetical protein
MEKHELELVTSTCTMSCNVLLQDCTRHTNINTPLNVAKGLPYDLELDIEYPRVYVATTLSRYGISVAMGARRSPIRWCEMR